MNDHLTSEVFVALLRRALGTGPALEAAQLEACEWTRFERLGIHHGVTPILYHELRTTPASVPNGLLQRMKLQYVSSALRSKLAQTFSDELAVVLNRQRIRPILLKGAALTQTLYENPAMRPLSDVDLLVDEGDVERAGAELRHMGLEPVATGATDERGPLCHMHTVFRRRQPRALPVELHWKLFEGYQPYFFDLAEVRAEARRLPGRPENLLAMSPEHELAYLCLHLDRHAVVYCSLVERSDWLEPLLLPQGLGRLVWLYDIGLYLQRRATEIDWDRFAYTARQWATDTRVHAVFEICRRALHAAPPPAAMRLLNHGRPRLAERVAQRTVLASYRASEAHQHSGGRGQARWLTVLAGHVLRASHTWTSMFPPTTYLRVKYSVPGSSLSLHGRHLWTVIPELWAETRDRLRTATRPHASDERPSVGDLVSERSVVRLAKDQVSTELGDEYVILGVRSGIYYGLQKVAARIWELLQEPRRVKDIRDGLVKEFDVEPQRCERELLSFLQELADKGLLDVTGDTTT